MAGNAIAARTWDDGVTNGGSDHLWSTAANWVENGMPAASDSVYINPLAAGRVGPTIEGGTLSCRQIRVGVLAGDTTTITMNSGTLTVGAGFPADSRIWLISGTGTGTANLVLNNGTITIAEGGEFRISGDGAQAHVQLNDGTINSGTLNIRSGGSIDIQEGQLKLAGDVTTLIQGYVSAGIITAYDGNGEVNVEYLGGQTIVTATPFLKARSPWPQEGASETDDVELSWTSGYYASSHDVYFGTDLNEVTQASRPEGDVDRDGDVDIDDLQAVAGDWIGQPAGLNPYTDVDGNHIVNLADFAAVAKGWMATTGSVFKGNQTGNTYDPGPLELYETYYWRIDEVHESDIWPGDVWSFQPTIPSSLGRGHQIFLKRGLLTAAVVFPNDFGFAGGTAHDNLDWDTWTDSGFNTVCTHSSWIDTLTGPYGTAGPDDVYYSRWCEGQSDLLNGTGNGTLSWQEELYVGDNLVALQAADEENLNDTGWRNAIKAAFDRWKAAYPDTLVYTTQNGPSNEGGIDAFQKYAKPDMSYMFTYEFKSGGSLDQMYKSLRDFREHGKKGIGATDYAEPIPYGMYFQSMNLQDRHVGQPELCLGMFTPIAYGYKMINAFVYARNSAVLPSNDIRAELFEDGGDSVRRPLFDIAVENNRQIGLMSETLVRLSSTGIYDVNGESSYITDFFAYAVPYMSSVSAQDNADVVIGKFEPLHEAFDGPVYSGQVYFMVVNANAPVDGTPAQAAKNITLNFDFGASGITSLQSINLTTGAVETVALTHVSGSQYSLTFNLDGGRGKLFKFNTGAPFVGFYTGQ